MRRWPAAAIAMALVVSGVACSPSSDTELLAATFQLDVDPCRGLAHQRATAVMVDDELAATVAHPFLDNDGEVSVAGLRAFDAEGREVSAAVVHLDPLTDVALLRLADPAVTPLTLADYDGDTTARFITYPDRDGTPEFRDIEILRMVEATLDGEGARDALELSGVIVAGDSGAPVLDDQGGVIGVIFATSRSSDTGWAIATSEFEDAMAQPLEPLELSCPDMGP